MPVVPCGYFLLENKVCFSYGFVNTILPFSLRTQTFRHYSLFVGNQSLVQPSGPPICVDCRERRIQNQRRRSVAVSSLVSLKVITAVYGSHLRLGALLP